MCAKLLVATPVVVAKLVVAKLGLATHMDKLVLKVAVPILVEGGKTHLLTFCLLPFAGEACCKLEVEAPILSSSFSPCLCYRLITKLCHLQISC